MNIMIWELKWSDETFLKIAAHYVIIHDVLYFIIHPYSKWPHIFTAMLSVDDEI